MSYSVLGQLNGQRTPAQVAAMLATAIALCFALLLTMAGIARATGAT